MSEKTEHPTPRRKREARKKGQIARSRMLSSSAVLAGGLFGLLVFAEDSAARLSGLAFSLLAGPGVTPHAALLQMAQVGGLISAPALCGALLGAGVVAVASAGLHLQLDPVIPKLERLNPAAGLKKLFGPRQLGDLLKGALFAGLLSWAAWRSVKEAAPEAFRAVRLNGTASLGFLLGQLGSALTGWVLLLLLLGAADYLLARRRHLRDLMMSRQEVKQEHRNSEGDPHRKAVRKSLHRQLAQGGPARGVKQATCVVVNPTHVAVALRYEELECDAPYLVAKGREKDALAIRREARRLGVPVVKDIALARSLWHYAVGEEVPEELYQAAAAVLQVALEHREPLTSSGTANTPGWTLDSKEETP